MTVKKKKRILLHLLATQTNASIGPIDSCVVTPWLSTLVLPVPVTLPSCGIEGYLHQLWGAALCPQNQPILSTLNNYCSSIKTLEKHWRVSITEHCLSSESGQWMLDKWTIDHWSGSRWETAPSGGRRGELSSTTLHSQTVIRQLGWFWCSMPRQATGVCRELRFIALAKILPVCLLAV